MASTIGLTETMRKLADELNTIDPEIEDPLEVRSRISAVAWTLKYLAVGMDKELELARERGRQRGVGNGI